MANLYWQRLVKADWPEYQKGPLSTVSDSTKYPRPSGSPSSNWIKTNYVSGDVWTSGTSTTYRCEGSNTGSNNHTASFVEGQEVWLRYWFVWEAIPTYSSDWNIFFQSHFGSAHPTAQPNIIIAAGPNRVLKLKHTNPQNSLTSHITDWQSPSPVSLDTIHKIVVGIKLSTSNSIGWIEWWFDDVNVVPRKAGANFLAGEINYWKQGIYRSSSVTGDAVFYNNGFQVFDANPGSSTGGAPPSNTAIPTILGQPVHTQTLTATSGTWTGSPTPTYAYQWQTSTDNITWANITGATATTLALLDTYIGQYMRVRVRATNSAGGTDAFSASVGPVAEFQVTEFFGPPSNIVDFVLLAGTGGFPPSDIVDFVIPDFYLPGNTTVPTISGTAVLGGTLTVVDNGTWTNTPDTYTYQWQADGVDIAGATSTTYTITTAELDDNITCNVTAFNASGSTTATSNTVVVPAEVTPASATAPVITGEAGVGRPLTSTTGTWNNMTAIPPTFTYQWQDSANGTTGWANISGATSSTYVIESAELNKYLRCVVTATNTAGSASANSNVLGPVAAAVAVTPAYPVRILVDAAFGNNPTDDTYTWTNIGDSQRLDYAKTFTYTRGRQNELAQTETGTATVHLGDAASDFDPSNPVGLYSTDSKPMLPIRARVVINDIEYPMFLQYTERLPRTLRVVDRWTERDLSLADGFGWLANASLVTSPATLTTTQGSNKDLTFTANEYGIRGQAISVTYDKLADNTGLVVEVNDSAIIVHLNTDNSSTPTSTAQNVLDVISAHDAASQLVTVALAPGSNGTGIPTTASQQFLTGGGFVEELSGIRIGNTLDAVDWPTGLRQIDSGNTMVAATEGFSPSDNSKALSHIKEVEASENSLCFVTAEGKVRFLERHAYLLKAGNLVTNPSFEADTAGWNAVNSTITRDNTHVHTGGEGAGYSYGEGHYGSGPYPGGSLYAMKVVTFNLAAQEGVDINTTRPVTDVSNMIAVQPSNRYTFSAYVWGDSVHPIRAILDLYDENFVLLRSVEDVQTPPAAWTRYKVSASTNTGATLRARWANLRFLTSVQAATTFWVDDVAFRTVILTDTRNVHPDGIPVTELVPSYDLDQVVNNWRVSAATGTTQETSDVTSAAAYGPRDSQLTSLATSDYETKAQAEWKLDQFKDPLNRVEQVTVMPGNDATAWISMLSLDVGSRITIMEQPPGFTDVQENDYIIQRINVTVPQSINATTFTFQLWPADDTNWLIFDHITQGKLDIGELAY